MILDLIVIGIIVLSFMISAKKGFVRSVWKITALIVTIVLVMALRTPTVKFLAGTNISDTVYDFISERLTIQLERPPEIEADTNEETEENKSFIPKFILDEVINPDNTNRMYDNLEESINRGTDVVTRRLTLWALNIIAAAGLFILIRVILSALFVILDGASKLPVINQANALLGGMLGAVNTIAVIYIACALISLFAAESEILAQIDKSILVKYLYNYNILLKLIIRT